MKLRVGESSNLSGYRSWTPPPSAGAPPQTPNPRPHQAAPTTHALPDPASDHKTPPHLVVSLAPSLPEPRPPGLAQVARVSLPTPRRSRVQKGRATPALSRPRPPGSASAPWPRRDRSQQALCFSHLCYFIETVTMYCFKIANSFLFHH